MKHTKNNCHSFLALTLMLIFLGTSFHTPPAHAFVGSLIRQTVRSIGSTGVRKAGQKGLQKGAQKGLQKGVQKGVGQATKQGGRVIGGKAVSKGLQTGAQKAAGHASLSSTVSKAVQTLPKNQQGKALNALHRSPQALAKTVEQYGPKALAAEVKHLGVGGKFVESFGRESLSIVEKVNTGQLIRLSRHTNAIQTLTPSARSQLLQKVAKLPEHVITTLEKSPNIVRACTALGITGIVVAGGTQVGTQAFKGEIETIQPDGTIIKEHGAISFNMDKTTEALKTPLTAFAIALALILSGGWYVKYTIRKRKISPQPAAATISYHEENM